MRLDRYFGEGVVSDIRFIYKNQQKNELQVFGSVLSLTVSRMN